MNKNIITIGNVARTDAAISKPHEIVYCDWKYESPTGRVRIFSLLAIINGQMKLFQLPIKLNIATEDNADFAKAKLC